MTNKLEAVSNEERTIDGSFSSLRPLTLADYDRLTRSPAGQNRDFSSLLRQAGFSPEIEGIDFSKCSSRLSANFSHLKFKNCRFPSILHSQFKDVTFQQCHFSGNITNSLFERVNWVNDCSFSQVSWRATFLRDSTFSHTDFSASQFFETSFENTTLHSCDLTRAVFNGSFLKSFSMIQGKLSETNFFQTQVEKAKLQDCDLTNTLFVDTKQHFTIQGGIPHHFTKPVVALGWDFSGLGAYTSLIREALIDNGAVVLLYNQTSDPAIQYDLLQKQTEKQHRATLISASEVDKVKKTAAILAKYSDGLVLPGGGDIESCYYDPTQSCAFHYYRTVLEVALLTEAQKHHLPVLGVCRGAQLINVFCEGTLRNGQPEEGPHLVGTVDLEWTPSPLSKTLQAEIGSELRAVSAHHQIMEKIGNNLHVVLKRRDIPKFVISTDGRMIGSQVHCEAYVGQIKPLADQRLAFDFPGRIAEAEKELARLEEDMKKGQRSSSTYYMSIKSQLEASIQRYKDLDRELERIQQQLAANKKIYQLFINKVISTQATTSSAKL